MDPERRKDLEFQDDFLLQLFGSESSATNHSIQNSAGLSENHVQFPRSQPEHNMLNGNSLDVPNGHGCRNGLVNEESLLLKEIANKNEQIKKMQNEFSEQYNSMQNQIIELEKKLSQVMQESFITRNERDCFKELSDSRGTEIEGLKTQMNHLTAQVYQLNELKISQDERDTRLEEEQKKAAASAKSEQKMKKQRENALARIKKMKQNTKKICNLLTGFAKRLNEVGLLTNKERNFVTKCQENEENLSITEDLDLDDPTEEISPLAEPVVAKPNIETYDPSEENDTPTATIISKPNLDPHVVNELPATSSTFLHPQAVMTSSSNATTYLLKKVSNTHQNVPTSNRPLSHKPHQHYFSKTCHDVLDDPLLSDEMDISAPELIAMKQQLGLDTGHFTPISPIPPTPTQRSKQHPDDDLQDHQPSTSFTHRPIAPKPNEISNDQQSQQFAESTERSVKTEFERRLTFTHQQSEGFDTEGDFYKNDLNKGDPQKVQPKQEPSDSNSHASSNKLQLHAKRLLDGTLTFQVRLPTSKEVHITADIGSEYLTGFMRSATNNNMLSGESQYNEHPVPRPSTPTPPRLQKPVFIKKEPVNDGYSPPPKKPKIAPDAEPFRLSTLGSKDPGSSGFVSYTRPLSASNERSEHAIGNLVQEQLISPRSKGRRIDFNSFNNPDPFRASTPVAFTFDAPQTSDDSPPDDSKSSDELATNDVEENVCVKSTSCINSTSNQLNELNSNVFPERTSPQVQSQPELPKESNPIESTTFNPISDTNVPTPVQSVDNINSNNNNVKATSRLDHEPTGYTSSESDQLEDCSSEHKFSSKTLVSTKFSNGSLQRRRKRIVSAKESFNDAQFIRAKGRIRLVSVKKTQDNSSESDNNKEKLLDNDSEKNQPFCMDNFPEKLNEPHQSNKLLEKINQDIEVAVEDVTNTQEKDKKDSECLTVSPRFKTPETASKTLGKNPDISFVSNMSPNKSQNNNFVSSVATERSNGINGHDKNIAYNNYAGNSSIKNRDMVNGESVKTKEMLENDKLNPHTSSTKISNGTEKQLNITKTSNGIKSGDEELSNQKYSPIKKAKRKLKNIATGSDKALVRPVVRQRSVSIEQECVQKEINNASQDEEKAEHKKLPKRTRVTRQKDSETKVAKKTSQDMNTSESEQENQIKERKEKSKGADLHNDNTAKQVLPNGIQNSSNCYPKTINKLTAVSQSSVPLLNGSSATNSSLVHYETSRIFMELEDGLHSTVSSSSHASQETSNHVKKHTNISFPVNGHCSTDMVKSYSNTGNPSPNTPKSPENSFKRKAILDSPHKSDIQNSKEIDLNPMANDPYLSDDASVQPMSNTESNEDSLKEQCSKGQKSPNINLPLRDYSKVISRKKTCLYPIPENQPIVMIQSMPLSPDPEDIAENRFVSSPASPDATIPEIPASYSNAIHTDNVEPKLNSGSTSLNLAEVKEKTSPKVTRRTRSKSLLVETTENTIKSSHSPNPNCCIVPNDDRISEIDSDNDSPLVIAEDIDDNEPPNDSNSQETSETSISPKSTNVPVRQSKRLKKRAGSTNAKKRRQTSPNTKKTRSDFSKIEAAFQMVEKTKYTEANSKKAIHNLVTALLDPKHSPDAPTLILLFVQRLCKTNRNPMIAYEISKDVTELLHVTESILVSALFQIESKGKARFPNLLNSVILTLYNLVLGKEERFPLVGLAALCRVLTQICKTRNSKVEPFKLCGELLQWHHRYAPYLIASMIGVWPEAFQVTEGSEEEENLFFGAIALGVKKNNKFVLTPTQWKHSETIFSKFLPVPALLPKHIPKAVESLTQMMRSKCFESLYDRAYFLTIPLVILCRVQGWQWAKEVCIETFIKPSIKKCTKDELNKIGFEFLLNLCAEIYYSAPEPANKCRVISKYFQPGKQDDDFMHMTAGICIIKLDLWKHTACSSELSEFVRKWHQHERFWEAANLFIRRSMSYRDLEREDIMEHTPIVNSHH